MSESPPNGCDAHLALARERLERAREAFSPLGLALEPNDCARRLRDPDLAAQLCAQVENICRACRPEEAALALEGVLALQEGAQALRAALASVASGLSAQDKAFGAYRANA